MRADEAARVSWGGRGGTGRRKGLKIPRLPSRAGSIPAVRTTFEIRHLNATRESLASSRVTPAVTPVCFRTVPGTLEAHATTERPHPLHAVDYPRGATTNYQAQRIARKLLSLRIVRLIAELADIGRGRHEVHRIRNPTRAPGADARGEKRLYNTSRSQIVR
jgi:hypothetical protein